MFKKILLRAAKQAIFYLVLLFLWYFLFALKIWPAYIFPAPLMVWKALIQGFRTHIFINAILISLFRVSIGFGISILFGAVLGILMKRSKIIDETFGRFVMGMQTLPSISWFPLAILWFGLSEMTIIFIAVMGSLFSITMSVYSGLKHIPSIYIQIARNMGSRRLKMLWLVLIPAAAPSLIVGLKQGWSFAWRSLIAGELLFVSLGLGYLLMMGRELNDISQIIAVLFIIILISIAVDRIVFGIMESRMKKRWGFE